MILGSHPSVVEPMEIIQTEEGKNVLVAYSLGNYISTLKYANADVELILNIQIAKSSDSDKAILQKVDYTPIYVLDNGTKAENRFELTDMKKLAQDYANENTSKFSLFCLSERLFSGKMEKSGIPQKQILEEIMKHTHHIIRLLTLAVVSCALAALLSGCTKEEFIAGYNEFLFGDWFPSPPSAGETTAAEGSASGDSGHVYAEPNPECDAKISSLMSELYSLESSARSDVSSAIQSAKDEYHALPASQRTFANKVSIAYKHLSSVESTYDSAVSSVVSEMRSVLREYNQPETIADQAWSYYQSAKSSMISSLGG